MACGAACPSKAGFNKIRQFCFVLIVLAQILVTTYVVVLHGSLFVSCCSWLWRVKEFKSGVLVWSFLKSFVDWLQLSKSGYSPYRTSEANFTASDVLVITHFEMSLINRLYESRIMYDTILKTQFPVRPRAHIHKEALMHLRVY